jgi:transposase-like protein
MPKLHTSKPPYSVEFRQQMVELVSAGRTPNELAKEFGCHISSIHSWLCQAGMVVSRKRSFCVTIERDTRQRSAPDLVNREFTATHLNQW